MHTQSRDIVEAERIATTCEMSTPRRQDRRSVIRPGHHQDAGILASVTDPPAGETTLDLTLSGGAGSVVVP